MFCLNKFILNITVVLYEIKLNKIILILNLNNKYASRYTFLIIHPVYKNHIVFYFAIGSRGFLKILVMKIFINRLTMVFLLSFNEEINHYYFKKIIIMEPN